MDCLKTSSDLPGVIFLLATCVRKEVFILMLGFISKNNLCVTFSFFTNTCNPPLGEDVIEKWEYRCMQIVFIGYYSAIAAIILLGFILTSNSPLTLLEYGNRIIRRIHNDKFTKVMMDLNFLPDLSIPWIRPISLTASTLWNCKSSNIV
jgi:hypothetical protein